MEDALTSLSTRKRSKGVTVFGIITILISISYLLPVSIAFLLFLSTSRVPVSFAGGDYSKGLILGLCWMTSAIYILKLKKWGRSSIIILNCYMIFDNMFWMIFNFNVVFKQATWPATLTIAILNVITAICFIIFFARPKVKEQFK